MSEFSDSDLVFVVLVALAAPIVVDLIPRLRLPSVVVELGAGIVIGPSVLGWVELDTPLQLLSSLGLAFLLFLAGLEIDLDRLRDPVTRLAGRAFLVSMVLAGLVGLGLHALGAEGGPLFLAVVLLSTSLGVVVPVLKDEDAVATDFGQLVMVAGSLAEFGSLVLLTLLFSTGASASTPEVRVLLLLAFAVAVLVAGTAITRTWRSPWLASSLNRLDDTSAQLRVRAAIVVLVLFVTLAAHLGVEAILGAFVAGALLRAADQEHEGAGTLFGAKLEAIGFGFLVPIFFVTSGIRFDVDALLGSASALVWVLCFLVGLLLVRALPGVLYRARFGDRRAAVGGVLQATSLSFPVVAAHIGQEIGQLDAETGAALVAAGLLSVVLFPAIALSLRPWTPA
ncbi:MAG: Na+/H+ antiporter-like protein [Acidimicrobiales bacterium]|nr:Na+/H+ antiporter-like protein [Acidimicrobiales bacterium]